MADKLHSQGGDTIPVLTNRVASGKEGTNVVNSTWQTIVTFLEGALGFLKTTLNLSDLNDSAEARTNLDVYSKGDVNSAVGLKADKTNVLEKDNTTTYVPATAYNPATKDYTDKGGILNAWTAASIESSDVDEVVSFCDCARISAFISVTGILRYSSDASQDEIIFTLPVSFPLFTHDFRVVCTNATTDESNELRAIAGTRNLVNDTDAVSTNSQCKFGVNIPII